MGILASVIKRECYDSDKMSNTPQPETLAQKVSFEELTVFLPSVAQYCTLLLFLSES